MSTVPPPPLPSSSPSSTTRKYKARVTAWKTAGSAPFTWSNRVSQTVLCKGILRKVCRGEGVRGAEGEGKIVKE